ncbi:Organic cation transporter protein [Chionoecetes opilio]|uniref:Organic cation transporter protein n=1 Tax=Chionoecetes opilio TaxID=41210 RepID=A0A8J4YGB8_CHIOP|nr:Organic cation transporter protein [Chionoecetes opilio]
MKDSDENINACGGSLTPNMTDDNVDVVATGEAGEVDAKEEMDAKETTFTMKPEDRSSGENGDANNPAKRVGSASEAFEHILFQVGSYGKWQWKIFFIVSFCGIFTAFHNLSAAFIAATPEHWCHVAALDTLDGSHDLRNGSVPWKVGWEGKGEFSSCTYYNRNWTGLVAGGLTGDDLPFLPTSDVPIQGCHDWVYDHAIYETTAVEEWDLVCLNKYRMSFIQSTYMGGVLAGALVLSELADKFGRRTISLVSAVGFLVASVSVAFVTPYPLFLIFRFFVAAFGSGIFLSNFVIIMETVGSEGRTVMGMMYQCFFAVGFMLLPAIAYFVNDWRSLQLWISIPSVLMLLYYWFLPESPRWLMLQGRYEDALKILRQVAKTNGGSLPPKEELDVLCDSVEEEIILLSTPNLRRRCLIIFFAWFVVSMVYYGLTFSGGNINASPYLLVFLSGLVEIPSYILSCWTLKKRISRGNHTVFHLEKLKDLTCAHEYTVAVSNRFDVLGALEDPEELWDTFKRETLQTAKECIGERPRSRHGFVSTETLEKIEESRAVKLPGNRDQHRALSRRTRTLLGRDKKRYVRSLAEDVEGPPTAYRALKKLRSKTQSRASTIRAADGRLVLDMDGQMARWAEYFGQLFTVDPPIEQLHTSGLRAKDADPPIDKTAPSQRSQRGCSKVEGWKGSWCL